MMFTTQQTDTIIVQHAPDVRGLRFRGFRGAADYSAMAAVINGCREVDQIERVETAERIASGYDHLVNCDPYRDMLFAEVDGQVIGYSRVYWRDELDAKRIYIHFGFLLPEWRHRGIGRAMLRYNQRLLQEIGADHPNDITRLYQSFTADTELEATSLLDSEGFTPVRHFFEMTRPHLEDLPDAPMPVGLEVRHVKEEHLQLIVEANNEAFQDHWGFSEDEEPTVEQLKDDPNFDPSLWRVAWEGVQVAGMVRSFIDRDENIEYDRKRGYTEDISVRRPWRKRGLARSLLVQSLYALKERGMTEAALGVDTENLSGALRLYKSVGFRPVKRFTVYQKAFDL